MSMSRRRSRQRGERSRRVWMAVAKVGVFLGLMGATGYYAFEGGRQLSVAEIASRQAEVDRLAEVERTQSEQVATLETRLGEARREADDFRQRYDQIAPSDEMKELVALMRARLSSGLDAKRLAFVITAAEKPRNCQDAATKRFLVKTLNYNGDNTWVRFSDLITVVADGEGGNNGAEQWYDAAKPVTVRFTTIGGKDSEVSGKLPLQHAMVVKNQEYRFTVAPGQRGFVEVTGDRCDFKS